MKGRKKLPDSIKSLRGTDQPCRMTDKPAVQGATVIKLPKVGLKGTAKKVFAVVATELMHNNLLDVYGVDMVVAYAREMALYHDMMADIEKEGVTIEVMTKVIKGARRSVSSMLNGICPRCHTYCYGDCSFNKAW